MKPRKNHFITLPEDIRRALNNMFKAKKLSGSEEDLLCWYFIAQRLLVHLDKRIGPILVESYVKRNRKRRASK